MTPKRFWKITFRMVLNYHPLFQGQYIKINFYYGQLTKIRTLNRSPKCFLKNKHSVASKLMRYISHS